LDGVSTARPLMINRVVDGGKRNNLVVFVEVAESAIVNNAYAHLHRCEVYIIGIKCTLMRNDFYSRS